MDLALLATPNFWISLASLTALLIVLDVDNIVFISILTGKLPEPRRTRARRLGLLIAGGMRGLFLLGASYIAQMEAPLFTILDFGLSGKDLLVLGGALFLFTKAVREIHDKLEGPDPKDALQQVAPTMGSVLLQIALLDLVFSVDSVLTAVGMTNLLPVMLIAIACSLTLMYFLQKPLSRLVERHPTTKILALAFLMLIGFLLVVEALHLHIPKGYVYSAMAFALFVELLNIRFRKARG